MGHQSVVQRIARFCFWLISQPIYGWVIHLCSCKFLFLFLAVFSVINYLNNYEWRVLGPLGGTYAFWSWLSFGQFHGSFGMSCNSLDGWNPCGS